MKGMASLVQSDPIAVQGRRGLQARVGNGSANHPDDILLVKAALDRLGRYRHRGDAHGYIDRRLHDAILGYQRDRGLRRDGVLKPGGETERCLQLEMRYFCGGTRA